MATRNTNIIVRLRDEVSTRLQRIGGAFGSLTRTIGLTVGASIAVGAALGRLAGLASQQENAEARLATAIRNGAGATDEQIAALKELAAERQRVTRFGDEQTIAAQAQLATFQLTTDQIAQLTPRTQDLAEASRRLGKESVDLEGAAVLVGKALSGNVGTLSRYGVVLSDAQRETLRFGDQNERVAALADALDQNFKGLAESLTPYEQGVISAKNAGGDLLEQLGSFITSSEGVNNSITRTRETFENWTRAIRENGGTIERFIDGTGAAFNVLGNTATALFNALLLSINKFESAALTSVRTIADGLSRITFGAASEALDGFVKRADARLAELEQSGASRFEALGESAAGFVQAGRDLNNVIFEGTAAQQAANEASRQAQAEAAAQRDAEQQKAEAIRRTSEALQALGIDAEAIDTGIGQTARDATGALVQLAVDGEASLAVIGAAARKATSDFTDTEIENFRQTLLRAADAGQITQDQLAALQSGLAGAKREAEATATPFERLQAAIAAAVDDQSLSGLAAVRAELESLRNSGELTGLQFEQLERQIIGSAGGISDALRSAGDSAPEVAGNIGQITTSLADAEAGTSGFANQLAGALNSAASLSEGAAVRVQELVERFNRLNPAGTNIIRGFEEIGNITRTVNAEFAEQNRQVDELILKFQEAGDATRFVGNATQLLNQNLVISEDRRRALNQIIDQGNAARERESESIRRNIAALEDEIAILNGADADRIRFERRRADLRERINQASGQTKQLLQEELQLLERAQKLERSKADETTRAADASERRATAEERSARAGGGFNQPRRVEVEIRSSGSAGASQLSAEDVRRLAAQLLPEIQRGLADEARLSR